jgi:hypothetical protein
MLGAGGRGEDVEVKRGGPGWLGRGWIWSEASTAKELGKADVLEAAPGT